MTLRARVAIVVAVAVGSAALIAAGAAYLVTRQTLIGDLDRSLRDRAAEVQLIRLPDVFGGQRLVIPDPGPGLARSLVQVVNRRGGSIVAEGQSVALPITPEVLAVAHSEADAFTTTTDVAGIRMRMLVAPVVDGIALQVALPFDSVSEPLQRLTAFLVVAGLLSVGGAVVIGATVARAFTKPIQELTATAERVAQTRDLRERIAVLSSDEIGRLADSFNTMLAALDESTSAQRQLVADASHELRTPIASLRTNIEVLARGLKQAPEPALRIVNDLVSQSAALSRLVADLLDLSREADPAHAFEPVAFDELVDACVDTARIVFPTSSFEVRLEPVTVHANPTRIERAVTNLLENAVKWNPNGHPVEVSLMTDGTLLVRDHGPGVAREHRERIFERFWRAPDARGAAGSGLGLAIVRRIARDHDGTVHVEDTPGGGATFVLRLPPAAAN